MDSNGQQILRQLIEHLHTWLLRIINKNTDQIPTLCSFQWRFATKEHGADVTCKRSIPTKTAFGNTDEEQIDQYLKLLLIAISGQCFILRAIL